MPMLNAPPARHAPCPTCEQEDMVLIVEEVGVQHVPWHRTPPVGIRSIEE